MGLPGTVDALRLSDVDRYPLPVDTIKGWQLDDEQWEAIRVRTTLELDALTARARDEVRFDYFNFFEDFAGKGGPLISPALFRKFLLPRYRRIIDAFRASGIEHIWLDSDGDTRVLLPLLIEAGITCHWPLEQASDMDPIPLRREYGRDLVFCGGIDKRELTKGKKEVEAEVNAKIPPMLEQGGFIPHLDHTFPHDIPYENFLHYMELKQKLL